MKEYFDLIQHACCLGSCTAVAEYGLSVQYIKTGSGSHGSAKSFLPRRS